MVFLTTHSLKQLLHHILTKVKNQNLQKLFVWSYCVWLWWFTLFLFEAFRRCSSALPVQDFEVRLGSAWIRRSHPSVFVKLIYCWLHNWKARGCLAGCTSTLESVVFFGHMVDLQLHIFLFPVWISHLHGKNLSCVLGFPLCGQHKGRWDGMWEKGVCSMPKCMFWCLFDSLGQWLMSVHTQS